MFTFVSKMKYIKEKILKWSKEHLKNIFKEKLDIEEELNKLNNEIIKNLLPLEKIDSTSHSWLLRVAFLF